MTSHPTGKERPQDCGGSIVVGTRASQLARMQTATIAQALRAAWPNLDVRERLIRTTGDLRASGPLTAIGGTGLFTREIERALLDHEIDVAVHSLKDLPTEMALGLRLGAVPPREIPWDALVSRDGTPFERLPQGATVGTGSRRRAAQLLARRPDLNVQSIRGNLDTRLRRLKVESRDAIVVAAAGLSRLGRLDEATEILPPELMLPAVGQGALGVQVREDDARVAAIVAAVGDEESAHAVVAERAFLAELGGGCQVPVGAHARSEGQELRLEGLVASVDGRRVLRESAVGDAPLALGKCVAELIRDQGGLDLLAEVGP